MCGAGKRKGIAIEVIEWRVCSAREGVVPAVGAVALQIQGVAVNVVGLAFYPVQDVGSEGAMVPYSCCE